MSAHSKFSPSSAKRWLTCPGSLTLPGEDRTSVYAAEGTAAHSIAQRCQLIGVGPQHFHGDMVNVIDDETGESDGVFEVTDEMIRSVRMFLDTVEAYRKPASEVRAETRVLHKVNPDFGGTIDCRVSHPESLTLIDLKYGAGVGVEVEQNEQLLSYLAIELSHWEVWPREITAVIVQPRYDHTDGPVRAWSPSHEEIKAFESRVLRAIDPEIDTGNELVVGDHCRWCPCKIHCPAIGAAAATIAKKEFDAITEWQDPTLSPAEINEILKLKTAVSAYFEALEKFRHMQMASGTEYPDKKLVHKFGNRSWKLSPEEMLVKLRNRGFNKADCFTSSIKSPTQMEDVEGMDKKWLAKFTERKLTGTKVVSASNKAPAVDRNRDAALEFEGLDDDGS